MFPPCSGVVTSESAGPVVPLFCSACDIIYHFVSQEIMGREIIKPLYHNYLYMNPLTAVRDIFAGKGCKMFA